MIDLDSSTLSDQLTNEFYILHLIYHRNRNQHRLLTWWNYLNILHRKLRKVIKLLIDVNRISIDSKIQSKNKEIREVVKYLVKKNILKKCYYEFNNIITLGQFVNLGLTLIGSLSRIHSLFQQYKGTKELIEDNSSISHLVKNYEHPEDDVGEILEYDVNNYPHISKQAVVPIPVKETEIAKEQNNEKFDDWEQSIKRNSSTLLDNSPVSGRRSRKKRKKKSEIDEIFG
ncbi:uncharacterized protein PRCAT00001159001 [Priceomyces carsonii]|uniref:uncharacterized protein n=1 Tax=Priceomyces carsonii TaxID=28549 RepID=UPI002ED99AAB|nr:unnamed protein product [Priceomyces carsonii]